MHSMPRQSYTVEFKRDAVQRVELGGKRVGQVAKELGISEQTLVNWCKAKKAGKLEGGRRVITTAQMETSRQRVQNVRSTIDAEILERTAALFAKVSL